MRTDTVRAIVRPICVLMLTLTLCAGALLEQLGYGDCPWWLTSGAGFAIMEWIVERAVAKKSPAAIIKQPMEQ